MTSIPRPPFDKPEIPPPADLPPKEETVFAACSGTPEDPARPPSPALPKGLRLLVIEHNTVLALDVEDMLLRNGATRVEVANSAAEALRHLDGTRFDAALLDLKLADGASLTVAARLEELGIPFAFAVDYSERAIVPPPFADRLVIGKPYSEAYLLGRLAELLAGSA